MATVIPLKNDVLFGRGYTIHKHHGNQQFRSMVDAQKPKFVQIRRKGKRAIALEIMQDIFSLEPPGRFLMESKGIAPSTKSENDDGIHPNILSKVWVLVDHDKAVGKILHRLRDKDPGGEDGAQPSTKKKVQKSSTLPDGNVPDKLSSQHGGVEGAFAGRAQKQSSGRVNENNTASGHKKNSSDSPNEDATWDDITGGEMDGNTTTPPIHDDQDEERMRSNILHSLHEECDWDVFFDQERDSRNSNCSIETTSVCSIESDSESMGSIESIISMNGTLKSEYLDIAATPGLHNGDVTGENATGEVLDGNTSPPIHHDKADAGRRHSSNSHSDQDALRTACSILLDENDLSRLFDEDPEGSEEQLELQTQTTGLTFGMDAALPNVAVNIMQQGTHDGLTVADSGSLDKEVGMPSDEFSSELAKEYLLRSPQRDTSVTSMSISVQEWMDKAITADTCRGLSRDDGGSYLQSAVDLALVLAKHLFDLLGTWDGLKLDDITSDNLMILVKPEPLALSQLVNQPRPDIIGVQFHFENVLLMSFLRHANKNTDENTPVDPRQTCARLGNILLEIFSKGTSISMKASHADSGNNHHCQDESDEQDVAMPSMAKRMAAVSLTSSDSIPDKAKRLLVDVGAPLSICRLVCDLLSNSSNPTRTITLQQAFRDLTQMKDNPQMFLFDRTSPKKALYDTHLFHNWDVHLFGRKREMDALTKAKNNIMRHCSKGPGFLFEDAFLAGYAGSGKSYLLRSLINGCEKDKWFVLKCKFDSKSVPLRIIAKAFDDFFGRWGSTSEDSGYQHDPSMLESFDQVSQEIFSAFDSDSFGQLCGMMPNMSRISPLGASISSIQGLSSEGAAGAAEKRLVYLINTLLRALCSSGRPVLLALDDLQWSDSVVTAVLSSFDVIHLNGEPSVRRGLMIAGTYRNNEVKEGDNILETIHLIKNSGKVNLTMLNVDGLSEEDINQLISAKLGLPRRYTQELATLIQHKTKGNPFFVIQFLKTIINNKMLRFSVRQRMWTWDCDTIDLQMISEGVAELLTSTFDRLPANLRQTLKIISLFGNQIEVSTVDQMNSGQQVLPFDMKPELDLAVKEGLLEKAGPLYAFSHDLIHQTLYNGMPAGTRRLLHKVIGNRLLECSGDGNHSMHLLAVDHINIYCKDGQLSHDDHAECARANAVAAHYAMAGSSFEKAQSYADMGIKLLQAGHWEEQYSLSLDLYEMSALLCYTCGDTKNMSSCLDKILAHANTFEDSLNAAYMLTRLLTSLSKPREAITNCLVILAQLGEEFPPEPDLTIVQNKLSEIQQLLLKITADRMKALPTMKDTSKLQTMKFLGMLCEISMLVAPMLLPLLSFRMMKLTFQFGFCSDSILGIFYTAYSVFLFADDVPLAYHVGKIGVMLREESQNKHHLRSRLIWVWEGNIKVRVEPLQAIIAEHPSIFKSAMLVGDVKNAMHCRHSHCISNLTAGEDLTAVSNHFALCVQQSVKYQQHIVLNMVMTSYQILVQLSGQDDTNVKSFDELYQIGKESNNSVLLFRVIMGQMCVHFWFRDYAAIMKLCEEHPAPAAKRLLITMRSLYEGIAALNLARQQPNEPKYRVIGEKAVKDMLKSAEINRWTFENKSLLLQAESHYLNQDFKAAENAYIASIKSAKDHKFMNEEAMAHMSCLVFFALRSKWVIRE